MSLKKLKPICYENSKLPIWLSRFAPIDIWAISLGPFVFCRGLMSPVTRRHETIHFQQQIELMFVGFYLLYIVSFFINLIRLRDGRQAYMSIPFEREAYKNEMSVGYPSKRKRYSWIRYIRS